MLASALRPSHHAWQLLGLHLTYPTISRSRCTKLGRSDRCPSRLGAAVDDMTSSFLPPVRIFPRATPFTTGFIQPLSGTLGIAIDEKGLTENLAP
jgi:hypothetical protein